MSYDSISATGAKPGDRVRCVGHDKDNVKEARFIVGDVYTVVDFCGQPCANGLTNFIKKNKSKNGQPNDGIIPWRGFGFQWELA